MKRFEEKWTAWLDDQLSGRELSDFEASLPDKATAQAEKADAKKLGELLKRELGAHALTNDEFFNHQLREKIVQENRGSSKIPTSTWWTIPRLLWAGAASLAIFLIFTFAVMQEKNPAEESQYLTQILNARVDPVVSPNASVSIFEVKQDRVTVLWTGQEDWLATSKFFGLHVDARGERQGGYVLNLKLYKEKELLLETEAKLSKRSPLVIKGPQVGGGQLLLVLVVQ